MGCKHAPPVPGPSLWSRALLSAHRDFVVDWTEDAETWELQEILKRPIEFYKSHVQR